MSARSTRSRSRLGALVCVVLSGFVSTGLCASCSEPIPSDVSAGSTSTTIGSRGCAPDDAIVECAPSGTMLDAFMPEEATKATGEPILLGTINQDTGVAGAFPELTVADKVAVDFINAELGGVDGRPIALLTCDTAFNPDRSQSCAQEMVSRRVAAVIGGIDIWGTGIETLENNRVPYVGGIPVSFEAARSPVSFQFSGGTWGAVLGMGRYAVEELDAERIVIIAADFGPITDAADLGQRVLEAHGARVTRVSVSPLNADMVQALNQAAQAQPDAIIALTADSGCKPTMLTAKQIGLRAPILYTGACASPAILDAVGAAADGSIFNLEAELGGDPDNTLYQAIAQRYGAKYDYDAQGAGTVSFRAVMNLYVQLRKLGAGDITQASVLSAFRATKDEPSFFGHPYTCDGEQLPGYPAMCAAQQSLGTSKNGTIVALTDWIDVRDFIG